MATKEACLDLLSVLASLDQRVKFDQVIAVGWSQALYDLPDEVLIPAGLAAARSIRNGAMVTVGMIEDHAQPFLRKIARDVKSARLRGLVHESWPLNRPVPAEAQEALKREFLATNSLPDEIAAEAASAPAAIGSVGRRVD